MNIFESIGSALRNVFANKLRSTLTMLGIIIGIGSVITITSIGEGSKRVLEEQFAQMGIGKLTVMNSFRGGGRVEQSDFLNMKDVELLSTLEGVKYISPIYNTNADYKLLNPKETKQVNITGVTAQYRNIESPELLYGRYINDNDVEIASKVVVIEDSTVEKLFGAIDPGAAIGEKVSIKNWRGTNKYTIIGITKNKNAQFASMFGNDFPDSMVMPVTTAMRIHGYSWLSQISIIGVDPNNAATLAEEITKALDTAHNTTDKYYVQNMMQFMDQINTTTSMVTAFISAVAGISLLVGGIGVMNIMLVTVTERTKEIGIRKSIGASNGDIRIQFLIEAIILTGIGGVLGLLLGIGGGKLIGKFAQITPVVSMQAILIAISISTLIGIVFGVYPASKAAKLDPIEALRYE